MQHTHHILTVKVNSDPETDALHAVIGALAINTVTRVSLSEQHVFDCVSIDMTCNRQASWTKVSLSLTRVRLTLKVVTNYTEIKGTCSS